MLVVFLHFILKLYICVIFTVTLQCKVRDFQ